MGFLLYESGVRESNSHLDLGKVVYYHYTNPAFASPLSLRALAPACRQAGADPLQERQEHHTSRNFTILYFLLEILNTYLLGGGVVGPMTWGGLVGPRKPGGTPGVGDFSSCVERIKSAKMTSMVPIMIFRTR